MYWDLNVPAAAVAADQQSHYLADLARLGLGGIALNVECDLAKAPPAADTVHAWEIKSSKKTKPQMHGLRIFDGHAPPSVPADGHVRQLKRITLQCDDMNALRSLNSNKIVQGYDVVAVEALSGRVFQYLCEQADVDLISFDMTSRLPFQIRKPLVDLAIKRGIYFEIKYMQALGDSSGRRYFFSNASSLIRVTKGRNLVFSSGAVRQMLLRSPYDIVNVGILVGLQYAQAREAVGGAAAAVIAHGEARRTRGTMEVRQATEEGDVDMEQI